MWIMNVAHLIVIQLGTLLPVINEDTVHKLLQQVRACWLSLRLLPSPITDLLRGQRFTPLEMAALEVRLLHELRLTPLAASLGLTCDPKSSSTSIHSGIPPPLETKAVATS